MWDLTNAGASLASDNKAHFGSRRQLDGVTSYTIGYWLRQSRNENGAIFNEVDERILTGVGFDIHSGTTAMFVGHNNVGSTASGAITINTMYSFFITWDSTNGVIIYRDGVSWHTDATLTEVPTVPEGMGTTIGGETDGSFPCVAGQFGNIAVWPNIAMTAPDAVMWHNGVMPHRGSVKFFHRCTEIPGKDEYTRQVPDCYKQAATGTNKLPLSFYDAVSLYSHASDNYYTNHGETLHKEMSILAGEELHRRRLPKKSYQITVPTEFLIKDLMDDLQITAKSGLESTGEGFGYEDAPTRLARIEGMSLNPGTRTVGLTLRDIKRQAVSYYNSFRAPYTITGRRLGVFELLPTYAELDCTRDSYAWGKDLNDIYQEYGLDQLPITGDGLLVESKSTNYFVNGSFKHQLTGWTSIDAGAGTITASAPTVEAFDSSITEYAIELVCGATPATDHTGLRQAIAGAGTGTFMALSFVYYAETANQMMILIQRASDSEYLQTLTGTWGAAATGLYPPLETAYKAPYRYTLPYIFDGNDTYTFDFYSLTPAGSIIWMYNAQFEERKFATGPITNETTAAYTREGSVVKLNNPNGMLLPTAHGTIAFEFEPLWDYDESIGNKFLTYLDHGTDNDITIFWSTDNAQLYAKWNYNATAHYSSLAATFNAGDTIKIAIHWLDDGELGESSAQGQLFAKFGSGAWQEAAPIVFTETLQDIAGSILYVGSSGSIDEDSGADGYFRYLHCFPEALPFEEIKALLGDPA